MPYPHELVIELPEPVTIKGFNYLPRQDQNSGWVNDYEIYVSADGKSWNEPVLRGTFPDQKEQIKLLLSGKPRECRFIRFLAKSGHNNNPVAAIAEIDIIKE